MHKNYELRPYQQTAVNQTLESLSRNNKVGCIMPTGSGKTVCFIDLCDKFLQNNPKSSVMILSHLDILTRQTAERFEKHLPQYQLGIFQAGSYPHYSSRIIIGTMQTSRSDKHHEKLRFRLLYPVDLIIIDEAHYLTCASYQAIFRAFPKAKQLGYTATPFKSGALMTNYFDEIAYSISLQELIQMGYLVPPNLIEITNNSDDQAETHAMIASIYKQREYPKNSIFFLRSIEEAKNLRNILNDLNIKAACVTSDIPREIRNSYIKDFLSGKINVLTTVDVLTAGFDSPNICSIFMPYGTKSPTTYMQRIGRGLRLHPGKTQCNVYVCGDSPTISRHKYAELQNNVLNAAKTNTPSTFETDLLECEPGTAVYTWTQNVVDAVKIFKEKGFENLSQILNAKKFPKRFLNDILSYAKALPENNFNNTPASDPQLSVLATLGYTKSCTSNLTMSEANAMIEAAKQMKSIWSSQEHIFPSGNYAGKHVSLASAYYVHLIKTKFPNSAVGEAIRQFERSGGIYNRPKKKRKKTK